MRITEARLKRLIKEEVEIYLLTEEMKGELLNEGIMKYLDKVFGRRERWEDLVDDIESSRKDEREHFFGIIMTMPHKSDDNKKRIIDGQQRITTTLIYLKSL